MNHELEDDDNEDMIEDEELLRYRSMAQSWFHQVLDHERYSTMTDRAMLQKLRYQYHNNETKNNCHSKAMSLEMMRRPMPMMNNGTGNSYSHTTAIPMEDQFTSATSPMRMTVTSTPFKISRDERHLLAPITDPLFLLFRNGDNDNEDENEHHNSNVEDGNVIGSKPPFMSPLVVQRIKQQLEDDSMQKDDAFLDHMEEVHFGFQNSWPGL